MQRRHVSEFLTTLVVSFIFNYSSSNLYGFLLGGEQNKNKKKFIKGKANETASKLSKTTKLL